MGGEGGEFVLDLDGVEGLSEGRKQLIVIGIDVRN